MQSLTIAKHEKYLRQQSLPVNLEDTELLNNISILKEYTHSNNVWAMAGVQLGIPKQLVYIKSTDSKGPNKTQQDPLLLINPKVIASYGRTLFWEACASCMDNVGLVERPYSIQVQYQDLQGVWQERLFEGFESTVISHEIDHLNGILHMDRAIEVRQLSKEDRIKLREKEPYKIISKTDDFYIKIMEKHHLLRIMKCYKINITKKENRLV